MGLGRQQSPLRSCRASQYPSCFHVFALFCQSFRFGYLLGNQIPLFLEYDLTLTASSIEKLTQTNLEAKALGK